MSAADQVDPRLVVNGLRIDVARYSTLKHILRGPEHYMQAILTPPEQTPAMRLGIAIHAAILEPEVFATKYAVMPDFGDMRSSKNREKRDDYIAQHAAQGVMLLSPDDHATCMACVAAVQRHGLARDLLIAGRVESPMEWIDPDTGLTCRGRPDFVVRELKTNIDLKTASDATPQAFARACANLLYHFQAAFYLDGHKLRADDHRGEVDAVLHLVVETAPPYLVRLYRLDDAAIERGANLVTMALRSLRECVDRVLSGPDAEPVAAFSTTQTAILPLALPAWAFYD